MYICLCHSNATVDVDVVVTHWLYLYTLKAMIQKVVVTRPTVYQWYWYSTDRVDVGCCCLFVHDIQSRTIINPIFPLYLPLTNVNVTQTSKSIILTFYLTIDRWPPYILYIVDQYLSNYWPSSNVLLLKNCLPMVLILKQIMLVLYVAVDQWLRLTLKKHTLTITQYVNPVLLTFDVRRNVESW